MIKNKKIAPPKYPFSKRTNKTDNYHGNVVKDPYRWLENDNSLETKDWVNQQNRVTQECLSKISFRLKLNKRFTDIWDYTKFSTPFKRGNYYYYFKNSGLQNQAILYQQTKLDGKSIEFLNPNAFSKDGTKSLGELSFNKEKTLVAYSVSKSGSDWKKIRIKNVEDGKELEDELEWLKFSSIAWYKNGFFYAGYDQPIEGTALSKSLECSKIFYHKLGTSQTNDVLIYEDADNPLQYYWPQVDKDERYLIVGISEGTSGSTILIKDLDNGINKQNITPLFEGFKFNYGIVGKEGNDLLVLTDDGAQNYQLIKVNPQNPSKNNWQIIISEQNYVLQHVSIVSDAIFCVYLKNASSLIKRYTIKGVFVSDIPLPGIGTVVDFDAEHNETEIFFVFNSYVLPNTIYRYNIAANSLTLFRASEFVVDLSLYETKQIWFKSKDGTKVPMFVTAKKGIKLDANNPAYLYGYGGFNINLTPDFKLSVVPFLEKGGVFVVANIRGGGEFGEAWHKAGMLEKKQNVFDDFIAAAEFLIAKGYTSASKLAIAGGSNGGLLVGACINQRPELFKVALCAVGVLDMLRYYKFTVGWGWVVEYGSAEIEEEFNYIFKYSPLHNVKEVEYPATLITTADHDDRVVPAHSYKFAAELQQKHLNEINPILIRVDKNAGHGAGKPTSKVIEELTDVWSFVFYNLGLKY